jgi:hypothetical protein
MEYMFMIDDAPEEDEADPGIWAPLCITQSSPVLLLRRPPQSQVQTLEPQIEFDKSIEAMLTADLEPFNFKYIQTGDPFTALMAIITLEDPD